MSDNRALGLTQKFKVERLTESSRGVDHGQCSYFVLDPQHDPLAERALSYYAALADDVGKSDLAADLRDWGKQIRRARENER